MTSATMPNVRDVSTINLARVCQCPEAVRWDYDRLDTCPFCGRMTPRPYQETGGARITLPPYPCDCQGALEHQASYEEYRHPEPERVPERYREDDSGIDCEVYADRIMGGGGIYLHGKSGRGKTLIAYKTAEAVEARGLTTRITKAKALITEINEALGEQNALFSQLRRCGLLVIDDLGAENVTDNSVLTIQRILDERCEDMKPVLITSNYARNELAERYAKANPVAAAAIASRLAQMTVSEEVGGRDWRRQ